MKEGARLKLKQLKVIIIAWMIMGALITVYDYLVVQMAAPPATVHDYPFVVFLVRNIGAGLIGALLGGSLMVFYVNERLREKPYGYTLLVVSSTFILIVAIISLLMGLILVPMKTGRPMSDPMTRKALGIFLRDPSHIKAGMAWSFIVAITQLLLQISSKFGHANFWNIIRGKYHRPQEEQKIFMFLDLNDSTTIAEGLGDKKYHSLLKDFFADITTPILDNKGSIYQYVGDEVVIAWNFDDGIRGARCVQCFFDMKRHILRNGEKYLDRYGLVPAFKAGLHCGRVIAGEVGIIKRDITYSGDVLNVTSRILGKCSEYRQEVIASSDVLSLLTFTQPYVAHPLGAIKLKGKLKEVNLNALMLA